MTTGTGRFNLVQGFIGTVIAIAAAISTGASGFVFERARPPRTGLLILSGRRRSRPPYCCATALTETKPGKYLD